MTEEKMLAGSPYASMIKEARVRKGVKQTDVAKAMEISVNTYSRFENHKTDISTTQLYLACQKLSLIAVTCTQEQFVRYTLGSIPISLDVMSDQFHAFQKSMKMTQEQMVLINREREERFICAGEY